MRRQAGAALGLLAAGAAGGFALDALDRRRIAGDPVRERLETHPPGEETTVAGNGGVPLHVELFGPADAPPVVLVHGWMCQLRFWRLQIHDLARDHRVIAYDLRGHGRSGTPSGGEWSPNVLADDLEAVLHATTPDRPVLLAGHSLGAMTMAAWAGRHPESVERRAAAAAIVNAGLGDLVTEALIIQLPTAFRKVRQAVGGAVLGVGVPLPSRPDPVTHRAVRYVALSPSASPAEVRFSEELVLGCAPRVRGACGRELSRLALLDHVEHLTVPTVVISGSADRLTPASHSRRIAEVLPQLTELIELEGCGHMGPIERAGEINGALRELSAKHLQPVSAAA